MRVKFVIAGILFLMSTHGFAQQVGVERIKTVLCKTWKLALPKDVIMVFQPADETEYPTISFLRDGNVEIRSTTDLEHALWQVDSSQHVIIMVDNVKNVFKVATLTDKYVQLQNVDPLMKQQFIKLFDIE